MSREFISLGNERLTKARTMLAGFEKHLDAVVARAVNRSIENTRANAVRNARDLYHVKAGDVRQSLKISRANKRYPVAVLSSTGSVLPAYAFRVRPQTVNGKRRTPVKLSIKKGGSATLDDAFIARVGGKTGVYERKSAARLPIKQLYGPSVPQMLDNDEIVKDIADKARDMLDDRLDHEIKRVLDGALK